MLLIRSFKNRSAGQIVANLWLYLCRDARALRCLVMMCCSDTSTRLISAAWVGIATISGSSLALFYDLISVDYSSVPLQKVCDN